MGTLNCKTLELISYHLPVTRLSATSLDEEQVKALGQTGISFVSNSRNKVTHVSYE